MLAVVVLAFFLVLKGPSLFAGSQQPAITATATSNSLDEAFKDRPSRAYLAALQVADPKTYAALEQRVLNTPNASQADLRQFVTKSTEDLVMRNAAVLAKADARHLDAMLNHGRKGLKSAARAGSKYCRGSYYASMSGMEPQEIERLMDEMLSAEGAFYAFGMELNTMIAEALTDARANPVRHGKLNSRDEVAMQSLVLSLMSDKQVMGLMMAGNSGADLEGALQKVNVCDLGDTLLAAIRTLPQDTKGRVWSEAMAEANSSNPFSNLGGISGF